MAPKAKARRPLDSAWQYCVRVNPDDDHRVICNFCSTHMCGGINRLKYHLARVACKDVVVCNKRPNEVTIKMASALHAIREQSEKRARYKFETTMICRESMGPLNPSTGGSTSTVAAKRSIASLFFHPRTTPGSQPSLESFNEERRKEANMAVRRF